MLSIRMSALTGGCLLREPVQGRLAARCEFGKMLVVVQDGVDWPFVVTAT